MSKNVAIIGGGLGGLSAGVALAQKGNRVTLFEGQAHVGGYAIAFQRDEFVFDIALHAAPAGAPGSEFYELISELGLDKYIKFIKLKEAFLVKLGNYTFQMPNNYQELFDKLAKEFPAEKDGLIAFQKDLSRYVPIYSRVVDGKANLFQILTAFIPKIPAFLKHTSISTEDYLSRFFNSRELKTILYQASVFFGIPMQEFPAINFMLMFHLLFTTGMFTIEGGGQALSKALEKRLQSLGASVILHKRIDKVLIKNNSVVAVRASDGTEYPTDAVISNVNTPVLVKELVGEVHFPSSYLTALSMLKPSLSVLEMHIGLDCHVRDVGISNHITTLFPSADIDACIYEQRKSRFLQGFSVIASGITDPQKLRNNESILSIIGGVSPDKWFGLTKEQYKQEKEKCTNHILDSLQEHFPAIHSHIKTVDLATPHTFNRYTGNPAGAILGFDCSLGKHRTIMKVSKIPIKNLYLANAWTSKLGGFMPSIKAGLKAAQLVSQS